MRKRAFFKKIKDSIMTRKAINFDLDTHKLEEWYPTPNWRRLMQI